MEKSLSGFSPAIIHLDLTGKCNFDCLHCRGRINAETIPKEKAISILDAIFGYWDKNLKWVELGGGEPLLVPYLEDIIRHIKEKTSAKVLIVSNASLFTQERADSLIGAGLDRIQFSLDGATKETHNAIRKNNHSFEWVMQACQIAKKAGLPFVLRLSILKRNVDEIDGFMQLAKTLGASEVGIRGCVYSGNADVHLADTFIDPDIYKRILTDLPALSKKHAIPYFSGDPLALVYNAELMDEVEKRFGSIKQYGGCMIGISYLYINNVGKIAVCPMLNDIEIGDPLVFDVYELWENHPFFNKMRNRELSGSCGTCSYKYICGGCRAQSYWKSKQLFAENPICRLEARR